ncbi:unnamed protein product [Microthlaspi erraticum]|uniref:Protein kinase domain-containing protein n=1 Tax=Microthlaspi erraticum TaxID=1685480 RepID=A0A6D2KV86_9BRAS|nr:unnamed protein product [Microthlaspi erraticum]
MGTSGFGSVYKGRLVDGQETVVKRLAKKSSQGKSEFLDEVSAISLLVGLVYMRIFLKEKLHDDDDDGEEDIYGDGGDLRTVRSEIACMMMTGYQRYLIFRLAPGGTHQGGAKWTHPKNYHTAYSEFGVPSD